MFLFNRVVVKDLFNVLPKFLPVSRQLARVQQEFPEGVSKDLGVVVRDEQRSNFVASFIENLPLLEGEQTRLARPVKRAVHEARNARGGRG